MFICASWGLLMPALRPPHTVREGDMQTIQVRARRRKDLEILKKKYMGKEVGTIRKTPEMDYNYRAYCTPEALADAVAKIVLDIDYVKFKETAKTVYKDVDLYDTYNAFWYEATRLGTPNEASRVKGPKSNVDKIYTTNNKAGDWVFTDAKLAELWADVKHLTPEARASWLFGYEKKALKDYIFRQYIEMPSDLIDVVSITKRQRGKTIVPKLVFV